MQKRTRQCIGIIASLLTYYIIHEGMHLLYAVAIGAFKQINLSTLGVQIDVFAEQMSDLQMGLFCCLGAAATQIAGYLLAALTKELTRSKSRIIMACTYYATIALLLLDPLYLSILCSFVGGGDMNGISLLLPEAYTRIGFGILLLGNVILFCKRVLPAYQAAFTQPA